MIFTFNIISSAGFMFHGKPLYVALAQRKEDRQAQLQLQYAQQIAGLAGPSTAIVPGGYPPFYYTATGVVSHAPPRAGLVYQPMALRPGWRANGSAPPARSFQQSPTPVVSNNLVRNPISTSFTLSRIFVRILRNCKKVTSGKSKKKKITTKELNSDIHFIWRNCYCFNGSLTSHWY
jgi:hypothetical protein